MTDDVVIQVNNVSKKFKSQVVLKDITLQCRTGRIYGFVGYNGSGKIVKEKIEIDANERAVNEKSPYCFFVCTTFDSFLNDLPSLYFTIVLSKVLF